MLQKEFVGNLRLLLNNNSIEDKLKMQKFSEKQMLKMRDAYEKFLDEIEKSSEYNSLELVGGGSPVGWYVQEKSGTPGHYPALYYYYYKGGDLWLHLFNPYDLNPASPSYDIQYPRSIWINSYSHDLEDPVVLRYLGKKLPLPTLRTKSHYLNWIEQNPFEVKQ